MRSAAVRRMPRGGHRRLHATPRHQRAGSAITVSKPFPLGSETDTVRYPAQPQAVMDTVGVANEGSGFIVPNGETVTSFGSITGNLFGSVFNAVSESAPNTLQPGDHPGHWLCSLAELGILHARRLVAGHRLDSRGGDSVSGSVSFLADGIAPFLLSPPIAEAGPDQTVACGQGVTLDGSATVDPLGPGDIASFQWLSQTGAVLATGATPQVTGLPVGTNAITLVVTGQPGPLTTGAQTHTTVTVTVEPGSPTFGGAPSSQVVQSCSAGSSAVPISVPQALVCGASVPVAATVTSFNGASVSIPVVGGSVGLPPGTGTIQFVATNQDGVSTTFAQTITVLAPVTFFGSPWIRRRRRFLGQGHALRGSRRTDPFARRRHRRKRRQPLARRAPGPRHRHPH